MMSSEGRVDYPELGTREGIFPMSDDRPNILLIMNDQQRGGWSRVFDSPTPFCLPVFERKD